MQRIDWEDPKKKGEAYAYLAKVFGVKKSAVSLAMSFKRNSLKAAQMRSVAICELGAKLLSDSGSDVRSTKILDSKGNVVKVVTFK